MAELVDATDSKPVDASHESSILSPGTMNHVFPRPIIWPLIASVLLLNFYFIFLAHSYISVYYVLWLGVFGIFFVSRREQIVSWLAARRLAQPAKFLLLGYGAVLLEEFFVAIVHSLTEGFTLAGFFLRLGQFWAFNVLAFTGFIIGWYVLLKRYRYSTAEVFLLVGAWGLFSEHTLSFLAASPIAAVLLILPTMSTYNLIIAPAIASLSAPGQSEMIAWKKYPYSFLLLFVLSIIPVLILGILRAHFPGAFPPCKYIACV